MARAAKKETPLTIEEKLAKALVPEDEQPYPVPENWCWVRLGAVCSFIGGGTPSKNNSGYWNGNIPWASVKDVKGDYLFDTVDCITQLGYENSSANMCNVDDLILVTRIEPGKTIIAKIETSINQDLKIVKSMLPTYFLHYFFRTFQNEFERKSSGTTVKGITISAVQNTPIPLPPLPEQQRIVALIESSFTDLDAAKEKLQAVLDGFSERKATILHQAFTGELTREWREKIGIGLDSWKDTILKEILDVRDGTHDSPQYHETGFPLITSKNLKNGKILEENLKFISKEDYDRINERSKVDSGDILFAMIGTIGNPTVIEKNPDFAIKNVALFKNINKVNVFFVKYYLESKRVVDKMTRESKGSTQRFVSLGYLRNFPIKTPTIEEQKEIVRVLDDIFAKESQSKATVESALAKIDTMKKAILATAFRGGFGTNDNSDESAEELLRKVL